MSEHQDIGSLIVESPEIRGGRVRIAGTGVTVHRIVVWYKKGLSVEEIVDQIPHPELAQVYAALSYYHANRKMIDTDLEVEEQESERVERQFRTEEAVA